MRGRELYSVVDTLISYLLIDREKTLQRAVKYY